MASVRTVAVALVALLVPAVLAGCLGRGDGGEAPPDEGDGDGPDRDVGPTVTDTTGAITGYVLDVAYLAIPNATVTLQETGQNVTTDDTGAYSLNGVEPGSYVLFANHSAFRPRAKPVAVEAGEIAREQFLLEQVPQAEPYVEVPEPFRGYIECANSSTGRCASTGQDGGSNHRPSGAYVLKPGLSSILFEMTWSAQQGIALNDDGRLPVSGGGMQLGVGWSGNNGGGSTQSPGRNGETLRAYLVREMTPDGMRVFCREGCQEKELNVAFRDFPSEAGPSLTFFGGPNSPNVVAQRPFTIYVTAWYNMERPDGYTAVPDV